MNRETLRLLEFPQVISILVDFAQTDVGREVLEALSPRIRGEGLAQELNLLEECIRFREEHPPVALGHLEDPRPTFTTLGIEGSVLGGESFLGLVDLLKVGLKLRQRLEPEAWPRLASHFPIPAKDFTSLRREIERVLDEKGNVREDADPELSQIRRRLSRARRKIQQKLQACFTGKQSKYLIQDPFVTQRNNRYVVPVKVESQHHFPGVVHGSSSSGATVFIEPFAVVELNNEFLYCEDREQEIIYRILAELTDFTRSFQAPVEGFHVLLGDWDALQAKVDFHRRFRCVLPDINVEGDLCLKGARHPLLEKSLGHDAVVPVDVALDEARSILVISGPNTGGKTVALKTTGLLVLMGLSGLPVPALEVSINRFHQVLADIGDHQSIAENLSTYSAHVLRVNEMITTLDPPSLILLDEVGAGTDPVYGASLGIAIIDHFRSRGAYVVATTHHQAIKRYATQTPQAVNSSVELDSKTLIPTYSLRSGIAAGSSALEIAQQLGLPVSILGHARQLLDEKEIQVEKYLSMLRLEMENVGKSRKSFEDQLKKLKERESELEAEFRKREKERQKVAEKALDQWGAEFKRDATRVVKGISDRFKAAEMRKRLKAKEEQLRETFRRKLSAATRSEEATETGVATEPFAEQDWVYDSFFKKKGQVVELLSGGVVLLVDGKRVRTQAEHLTKIEKKTVVKRPSPAIRFEVVEDTDPELNVIGCTVDDALDQLDKFLDRAFLSQLHEVRIIHGFGTGRLKNAISTFLRDHAQVVKFKVEGGATVAVISE